MMKVCAGMKVKIKEEFCGGEEEKERQEGQLLDRLCRQPLQADVSEDYLLAGQEPALPEVKKEELEPPGGQEEEQLQYPTIKIEEQLSPCIKKEEDFIESPVTGAHVKTEDEEGQHEEKKWAEPLSPSHQMTTEIGGEHHGGSQADGQLAPTSDGDDTASHSSRTDNDDEMLEDEMTVHTDGKRWKCSQCGNTFVRKSSLKMHMMGHSGEKPFACSVCGKKFSRKQSLTMHATTHSGEKPFACSICGKTFARKKYINVHKKIHSSEKPFACSVCGKRFSWNENLRRHTQTHTYEKPFVCVVCGQRFLTKQTLSYHRRTHTGEKPFACSICGLRFSQSGHLKRHTKTHTGEKPFSCSVCLRRFSQKSSLKKHIRSHAGEKLFA